MWTTLKFSVAMIATYPSLNGLPTSAKKTGWELPPRVPLAWPMEEGSLLVRLVDPATPLIIAIHIRDSHQGIFRVRGCTTRSTDQHRPSTTTVTMASHTGISVSATIGVVISSLNYTQNYQAFSPIEELSALEQDVPEGVQLSHTHGANNIPLELPLKRVFSGNIPTGLTTFILLRKRSRT